MVGIDFCKFLHPRALLFKINQLLLGNKLSQNSKFVGQLDSSSVLAGVIHVFVVSCGSGW
jgi:hypothetical protein